MGRSWWHRPYLPLVAGRTAVRTSVLFSAFLMRPCPLRCHLLLSRLLVHTPLTWRSAYKAAVADGCCSHTLPPSPGAFLVATAPPQLDAFQFSSQICPECGNVLGRSWRVLDQLSGRSSRAVSEPRGQWPDDKWSDPFLLFLLS